MRRCVLLIMVSMLTFSASGLCALIVLEPCIGLEQSADDDGACPPTCVTCGCCAQGVEPVVVEVPSSPDERLSGLEIFGARLTAPQPRDILHVPRRLA